MRTNGNWSFRGLCSGETDVSGNSRYNINRYFHILVVKDCEGKTAKSACSCFLSTVPVCVGSSEVKCSLACLVYVCTHTCSCVCCECLWGVNA